MRTPFIAGNWKMYKTRAEAKALAEELKQALKDVPHRVLVAPPFTALETVASVLAGSTILLGAQNMSVAREGAHTGEIAPRMLKDIGVQCVILGHSERRHSYGETDSLINEKVVLALEEGLEPILCVGETLDEREAGQVESVVGAQIEKGLAGLTDLSKVTIAYEPVWAIGTGKTATPDDAEAVHAFIRKKLNGIFGSAVAETVVIQYGGSVKPDNVKQLMAMPNIDGALVGGASLKAETFIPIVKFHK